MHTTTEIARTGPFALSVRSKWSFQLFSKLN